MNVTKDLMVSDKLTKHGYRKDHFDGRNVWHVSNSEAVSEAVTE